MKKTLHKYFVPHEGNNFHPHILHAKRAILYGGLFVGLKALVVAFAVMIPAQAFLTPDVLSGQKQRIVELVNVLREENGLKPLASAPKLNASASARAADMLSAGYFSHQGPDGRNLAHFLKVSGYDYYAAGENLAMGFNDAQDVVAAWVKSPTHYANLIDKNFTEEGLGIYSGDFQGSPTVFVAEHYGMPKDANTVLQVASGTVMPKPEATAPITAGTVKWSDEDTRTKVAAEITVDAPIKAAVAEVNGFEIKLKETSPNTYAGTAVIPEKSDEVFKVVTSPTVRVTAKDDSVATALVKWESPKVVSQTPWERYVQANSWLGKSIPLFAILKLIYILAAIFFSIALAVHIYYEVTRSLKHKWPIWLQSLGFIALLVLLIKI